MPVAYLLTGSNMGNRAQYLALAEKNITAFAGKRLRASSIYETASWGDKQQQPYLNQVLAIDTILSPGQLMDTLLDIEQSMGRLRDGTKWAPRTIDIDILLFDDIVLDTPGLIIPHPHLADRRFALVPLNEIAAKAIYMPTGETISELLINCTDTLPVSVWPHAI